MMKKMLPVVMGAIFALSVPASGYDVTGVYPHTGKVISVEEVTVDEIFCDYLITIVDCAGRSWAWFDDAEDWEVDDLASVIMYDNGTVADVIIRRFIVWLLRKIQPKRVMKLITMLWKSAEQLQPGKAGMN